jgi:hypothetical protein
MMRVVRLPNASWFATECLFYFAGLQVDQPLGESLLAPDTLN